MKPALWWFVGLLLIVQLQISSAQCRVEGRVTDREGGKGLSSVNILVLGSTRGTSSQRNGDFRIDDLRPGSYRLLFSRIGYGTETRQLTLSEGRVETLQIALTETAVEMDPIVVMAGKTAARLDQAAMPVSVVSQREIALRNPTNLVQAMEGVPGVHFVGDQINIRGSTGFTFGAGNKVLLLIDGVPVYAADTGEFNWDMLPPSDVERIEVLKGAGSTLWGASALGGVVNILTKTPDPEGRVRVAWSGGQYAGPYYKEWNWTDRRLHYTREDVSYSRQFNRLGLRCSLGRMNSTGYNALGDWLSLNATIKTDVRFARGIKWTVYGGYSRIRRGYFVQWKGPNHPYEVDAANLGNRATVNQLNLYTKVAVPVNDRLLIQLRASMVRSLMGSQFGQSAGFNPAYGQGAEAQLTWMPSPLHTVTGGLQFQMDSGSTAYFGTHRGVAVGPYLQDEWRLTEALRLTLGLRYDRYQLTGGAAAEDLFSPRFGLNWEATKSTILRASLGSGFRAATIVERFLELSVMNFNIISNPGLRAEQSWAVDVGMKHYFTPSWNVDVSLFHTAYSDLIEAHMNLIRGQIQFRNIDKARVRGIELATTAGGRVFWLNREWLPSMQVNLTAMSHRDLRWDRPLPYRPKVIGSVKAGLRSGAVHMEASYRYASRIDAVKIYPINARVAMHFVDLRFSTTWRGITAQLGVNNLLHYNYAPMESNLMAPRTFTAGLSVSF